MAQTPEQRELTNWRSVMASARVTFDGIAVVIQTTVIEDTEIKLRRGVAAFGGKKQVLYGAALHQSIQTTGRDERRFRTPRTPSARSAAIVEPRAMDHASRFTRQLAASSGTWD